MEISYMDYFSLASLLTLAEVIKLHQKAAQD